MMVSGRQLGMLGGLGVGAVIAGLFILAVLFPPDLEAVSEEPQVHGQRVVYHQHVSIWYYENGARAQMPAGIGIGPDYQDHPLAQYGLDGLLPLHTHDVDGLVHIEPTQNRTFTFGDWLDIWKPDIEGKAVTLVKVNIDGSEQVIYDYRNYVLQNGDRLQFLVDGFGRLP